MKNEHICFYINCIWCILSVDVCLVQGTHNCLFHITVISEHVEISLVEFAKVAELIPAELAE